MSDKIFRMIPVLVLLLAYSASVYIIVEKIERLAADTAHHDGVYTIAFGDGRLQTFTVHDNRLHLMIPLPVTSDSSQINVIEELVKENGSERVKVTSKNRK